MKVEAEFGSEAAAAGTESARLTSVRSVPYVNNPVPVQAQEES